LKADTAYTTRATRPPPAKVRAQRSNHSVFVGAVVALVVLASADWIAYLALRSAGRVEATAVLGALTTLALAVGQARGCSAAGTSSRRGEPLSVHGRRLAAAGRNPPRLLDYVRTCTDLSVRFPAVSVTDVGESASCVSRPGCGPSQPTGATQPLSVAAGHSLTLFSAGSSRR
jgi:hypothetical protein